MHHHSTTPHCSECTGCQSLPAWTGGPRGCRKNQGDTVHTFPEAVRTELGFLTSLESLSNSKIGQGGGACELSLSVFLQ